MKYLIMMIVFGITILGFLVYQEINFVNEEKIVDNYDHVKLYYGTNNVPYINNSYIIGVITVTAKDEIPKKILEDMMKIKALKYNADFVIIIHSGENEIITTNGLEKKIFLNGIAYKHSGIE